MWLFGTVRDGAVALAFPSLNEARLPLCGAPLLASTTLWPLFSDPSTMRESSPTDSAGVRPGYSTPGECATAWSCREEKGARIGVSRGLLGDACRTAGVRTCGSISPVVGR